MGVRTKLVISTVLLATMLGVGVTLYAVFACRAALQTEVVVQGMERASHWGSHLNELAERINGFLDQFTLSDVQRAVADSPTPPPSRDHGGHHESAAPAPRVPGNGTSHQHYDPPEFPTADDDLIPAGWG